LGEALHGLLNGLTAQHGILNTAGPVALQP
jgi:hypothetical protein